MALYEIARSLGLMSKVVPIMTVDEDEDYYGDDFSGPTILVAQRFEAFFATNDCVGEDVTDLEVVENNFSKTMLPVDKLTWLNVSRSEGEVDFSHGTVSAFYSIKST